jgi:hypothetical protein
MSDPFLVGLTREQAEDLIARARPFQADLKCAYYLCDTVVEQPGFCSNCTTECAN